MENEIKIQELIEQFDFSELTKDQKEQVLRELTEIEYQNLRETIKMTVDYFEDEPNLLADTLLKPVLEKEGLLLRVINYNVPLYKIAAAVLLVLSINLLIPNKEDSNSIEIVENVNEEENSDTLYVADKMLKYTSNNSIKYNTGLARVY